MAINLWSGAVGPLHFSGINHFLAFARTIKGKKRRRGRHIIWMVVVCVIWMNRNNIIFKDGAVNLFDMIANIIILSWNWFVNIRGKNCWFLYSEWCTNPVGCIVGTWCLGLLCYFSSFKYAGVCGCVIHLIKRAIKLCWRMVIFILWWQLSYTKDWYNHWRPVTVVEPLFCGKGAFLVGEQLIFFLVCNGLTFYERPILCF